MPKLARTVASATLALLVAGAAVGAHPQPVAAGLTISQAELEAVRLLNVERSRAGLVPVRVDSRLMSMARQRSADMINRNYFGHVSPSGKSVFDMIIGSGMTWYGAGEIIAWNTWPGLADSATAAKDGWMGSPSHRAIVMSNEFNYVGLGLAVNSSGKRIWTGVFIKGPDRTGGWTKIARSPTIRLATSDPYRVMTTYWAGGDIRLQTLTSGFRHYQVQVRTNGGSWKWLSTATLRTQRSLRVYSGTTRDIRIRACDNAGNCGAWATQRLAN